MKETLISKLHKIGIAGKAYCYICKSQVKEEDIAEHLEECSLRK